MNELESVNDPLEFDDETNSESLLQELAPRESEFKDLQSHSLLTSTWHGLPVWAEPFADSSLSLVSWGSSVQLGHNQLCLLVSLAPLHFALAVSSSMRR